MTTDTAEPIDAGALPTKTVEKPWGRDHLPPPFATPEGRRIGEIWFEPPPSLPELLVKYIFTSENLSVQVHPSDAQTQAKGLGRQGKAECWLVIDAQPGAVLGIGFNQPVDAETMRAAALDGSIEGMLAWHKVRPGDFYYIPENTVHAIGAGIGVIEIQQNSDITYRLYDYGRPRELHLDAAIAVALGTVYDPGLHRVLTPKDSVTLVDGPHFRLDVIAGLPGEAVAGRYAAGPLLAIPLEGDVHVGGESVAPGGCALADEWRQIAFDAHGRTLVAQALPR